MATSNALHIAVFRKDDSNKGTILDLTPSRLPENNSILVLSTEAEKPGSCPYSKSRVRIHDFHSALRAIARRLNFETEDLVLQDTKSGRFVTTFDELKKAGTLQASTLDSEIKAGSKCPYNQGYHVGSNKIVPQESEKDSGITTQITLPIPPGPTPLPLVKNLPLIMRNPFMSIAALSSVYGNFFPLHLLHGKVYVASDPLILAEVEARPDAFGKRVEEPAALANVRPLAKDGLFTASDDEPNWKLARNILMPAFSSKNLKAYIPEMVDKVEVLLEEWQKLPADFDIDMSVDTICHIGFGYEFNSLRKREQDPFVDAMIEILEEALNRTRRTTIEKWFSKEKYVRFDQHVAFMHKTVNDVIAERVRQNQDPSNKDKPKPNDILTLMLDAADPETGEKLSQENMMYQVITFLIAGHETTSSMLAWAFYLMTIHPEVERKVLEEVDRVMAPVLAGKTPMTDKEVGQLKYTLMLLKETLRLFPPASAIVKNVYKDTKLGPYEIKNGDKILFSVIAIQRNIDQWGTDSDVFEPEHFSPERESKRNPSSFCAFGAGLRSCLGMKFALIEARIVFAYVLSHYRFKVSPRADVCIEEKLALRPKGLILNLIPRKPNPVPAPAEHQDEHSPSADHHESKPTTTATSTAASHDSDSHKPQYADGKLLEKIQPSASKASLNNNGNQSKTKQGAMHTKVAKLETPPEMLILYGSDSGACEDQAHELQREAVKMGFPDVQVAKLNDYANDIMHKVPLLLVVTSTYNGNPPNSALMFHQWLDKSIAALPQGTSSSNLPLAGLRFAVFGVGNTDWNKTYQKFPRSVDERLVTLGATRIFKRGEGNVNECGDIEHETATWRSELWTEMSTLFQLSETNDETANNIRESQTLKSKPSKMIAFETLSSSAGTAAAAQLRVPKISAASSPRKILEVRDLLPEDASRRTVHIEIELAPGEKYVAGDHFNICPENSDADIEALAKRLLLPCKSLDEVLLMHKGYSNGSRESMATLGGSVAGGARPSTAVGSSNAGGLGGGGGGRGRNLNLLPLEQHVTIRLLLKHMIDIRSAPPRSLLAFLSRHATNEKESKELHFLSSLEPESAKAFTERIVRMRKNLLTILEDYPSVCIPFDEFLEVAAIISPRLYSISSAPSHDADRISMTVGMQKAVLNGGVVFEGFCSNFIGRLKKGDTIMGNVKSHGSSFAMPDDVRVPMVMVCAGTGYSPFRGFLWERKAMVERQKAADPSVVPGTVILVFGCRRVGEDDIYRDEIKAFLEDGTLTRYEVAESRPVDAHRAKEYVQDRLLKNDDCRKAVWQAMHPSAADGDSHPPGKFYVCGDGSGMARGVQAAMAKVAALHLGVSEEEGNAHILKLVDEKHYIEDVWG